MNKKLQTYFKKTIVSLLILSILSVPFLEASKVYAQAGSYSAQGSYPSGNQVTGGIGGYIKILGPAIQELPHCRNAIASSWAKNLFGKNSYSVDDVGRITDKADAKITPNNLSSSESIPVADFTARAALADLQAKAAKQQAEYRKQLENELCLKSIGQMVVKMLLQKITVSTVEWINNGFEGKPLFLQNPGQYFGDIAKNEILGFKLEIDDPELYPFGRNFLKSQVGILTNRFNQNARYSANELIQRTTPEYSSTTFSADFSQGGWNAWSALTQVPANNPIGFNIIASNELSIRLKGTSSSPAEKAQTALDQSGGFLGDERCAEPENITREQHRAALIKGERDSSGKVIGICTKWEYVTPGKLIAESATKLVSYPDNQLLKADDLNAAIAAVMDALLNRWSQDLANKGFAGFSSGGVNGGFIIDGDNRTSGAYSQTELDFPKTALGTNWLKENSDFNIRTDLTQAVIDEQRIYQRKILEQNQILDDLITTVYQLDYCIPGPHPGFEEDSRRTLNAAQGAIPSKTAADFEGVDLSIILSLVKAAGFVAGAAIGASIGTAVLPVVGTAIGAAVGFLIGAFADWVGQPDIEEKVDIYYGGIMRALTGVHVSKPSTTLGNIRSKQDITNAMDTMLDRYIKLIHKNYTKEFLPTIAPAATVEFRKISGYRKTVENNEYAASVLDGVIVRLAKLKDKLDEMNPEIKADANSSYDDYLPLINEFSRLSASMVTGNDIGVVTDDNKEYSAQIKYVYDDLLTGEYGCEKDLEKERQGPGTNPPVVQGVANFTYPGVTLRRTKRAEYPFRIWYDYNKFEINEQLPDIDSPNIEGKIMKISDLKKYTDKKNKNKMPPYDIGKGPKFLGPGFLSDVYFAFNIGEPPAKPNQTCAEFKAHDPQYADIFDCIYVGDLFYNVNSAPVSVGRRDTATSFQKDVSFEQTIGVY